jgi:hypothetical protein
MRDAIVGGARARVVAVVLALVFAVPATAFGDAKDSKPVYRIDDPAVVYLGNPRLFKKPCEVSADTVYRAIPEYREILEKNLTDKDVRYHFLMKKASDKFAAAVKELAKDRSYDLVAGKGGVIPNLADAPAVPDETDGAIQRLPS